MSRILTVPQAAEKLQMSLDVVREYLRTGKLPGRKVGKAWRVVESDLENWISAGQNERTKKFASARGLLKSFTGTLSSEEVCAEKLEEAELEESKFQPRHTSVRRSA
jgi:excisionase family DNA binding protein